MMNQLVQFQDQVPSITPEIEIFNTHELTVNRLDKGSKEYETVDKSFISGMRDMENKKIKVVGIHRKKYVNWGVMDEARLGVFRLFAAAVETRNGGDPNIKFGWYGGSFEEIKEIVMYGFRRFGDRGLPDCGGGGGVHLSPANMPMERLV